MDFTDYPVCDNHCHPFRPDKETDSYEHYWTLSQLDFSSEDLRESLVYRMVIQELARFLDVTSGQLDEVVEARADWYKRDPSSYISALFADGAIEQLVMDIGYPVVEFSGYTVDLDEFRAMIPDVDMQTMIRIEVVLQRLLNRDLNFEELVQSFNADVEQEIKDNDAVALKTAIAYRTGLEIQLIDSAEARKGYESFRSSGDFAGEKALRDFLFCESLELCRSYEIPMQIHTGLGDSPTLDLRTANPLKMFELLSADTYRDLDIILVHAGYPFTSEAAFLAHNYPNVWVDMSQMIPFAGIGIETHFRRLLELAPVPRIMFGSDGYNIPELFWFSAVYFKKVLGKVFTEMVEEGTISAEYADRAARLILSENAERVYRV